MPNLTAYSTAEYKVVRKDKSHFMNLVLLGKKGGLEHKDDNGASG